MPLVTALSHAECERLLRAGVFGRAAFATPRGPEIVPVNYAVVDDAILIRTDPASLLAAHAEGKPVAFQVDLVDHERWHGWSVVARGLSECVADSDMPSSSTPTTRPRTWAAGARTTVVRIAWAELTGRRLGTGWDCLASMPVRQVLR